MKTRDKLNLSYMYKTNPHKNKLYDGDDMLFGWDFMDDRKEIEEFFRKSDLKDFLFLIAKAYKDKYANDIEFSSDLSKTYNTKSYEKININFGKSKLRKDVKEFEWEIHYRQKYVNDYYLNRLKITFTSPQDATVLKENVEQALQGKTITENGDTLEIIDSALLKVKISANYFEMWINPDKAIYY